MQGVRHRVGRTVCGMVEIQINVPQMVYDKSSQGLVTNAKIVKS
jgi:hypothetical protein